VSQSPVAVGVIVSREAKIVVLNIRSIGLEIDKGDWELQKKSR
jgi:hypothetical protein